MWCKPNGRSKRSNVPYKNGAKNGAEFCDDAIHVPNPLIPDWMIGQTTAMIKPTIIARKITTNGTKRFPLKNDKTSGNLR